MDEFGVFFSPFMIPIVAIAGGILMGIVSTLSKSRIRELEIRERIAMIERGLVPPPETDPAGFERRMRAIDHIQQRHSVAPRFRSGGIMVMSVGFGLTMLLWFVGAPREGVGVGGFLVIIGLGMLVNSLFSTTPAPLTPPTQSSGDHSDTPFRS